MITSADVSKMFHVRMGMRHMVIPGVRMHRMVPNPCRCRPNTHRSPPIPGPNVVSFDGAYANHTKDAAPCGVMNPAAATREPNRKNQNARALSRGNATSGHPTEAGR